MSFSITSQIVDFLLQETPSAKNVTRKGITHITDGIAVMLAGSRTKCVEKLVEYINEIGCLHPSSTIVGYSLRTIPSMAALVNGASGHADDYDDTQLSESKNRIYGLLTHPTVPVLAAALAIGEKVSCSGREFLDAFLQGFEVECKLAEAINPEHYMKGFHTTGTIGAFGACATAGKLLNLNEDQLRYALGITTSMCSGIRINFGTMTKPLHAGMAASNGVTACMLAKRGFTADKNALDGKWGFMNIFGHGFDPGKIIGKLGKPYSIIYPGASIKIYPCGSLCQPSMDALLGIILEKDIQPKDVREIRIYAGPNILEPLRYKQPINGLQAKFSLQFGMACILLKRRAGLREYTTAVVKSREISETMSKIKTFLSDEVAKMGTDKMRSIIEIELQNKQIVRKFVESVRGMPETPIKNSELVTKFNECASFVHKENKINQILEIIRDLENKSSIKPLISLLSASAHVRE